MGGAAHQLGYTRSISTPNPHGSLIQIKMHRDQFLIRDSSGGLDVNRQEYLRPRNTWGNPKDY